VSLWQRFACLMSAVLAMVLLAGRAPRLVSPYDVDLQRKASVMQAEVAALDLTMRGGAGTVADDPRHPDFIAALNK